jgi:hypothetical protein
MSATLNPTTRAPGASRQSTAVSHSVVKAAGPVGTSLAVCATGRVRRS